jgi:hypothetical protein
VKRQRLSSMAAGFLLGGIAALVTIAPYVWFKPSGYPAFRQVYLGMSQQQMQQIFERNGITYECSTRGPSACYFSDFWREYRIGIDRGAGIVSRKSFTFKESRYVKLH